MLILLGAPKEDTVKTVELVVSAIVRIVRDSGGWVGISKTHSSHSGKSGNSVELLVFVYYSIISERVLCLEVGVPRLNRRKHGALLLVHLVEILVIKIEEAEPERSN